jgi:hypothetical protein
MMLTMNPCAWIKTLLAGLTFGWGLTHGQGAVNVYLADVPDYPWWAGCFGTACGNLMGFWDRHGFPNFYTGPTQGGVAPLDTFGENAGIVSMWASQAGVDGRPWNQYGHYDDYYLDYESLLPDPYLSAGRPEHAPDCIGDFIGLSQWKWVNLDGECDGNIDGYSFVYWDASGERRVNYVPTPAAGSPARDLQSGLRAWTQYRGCDAEVFTQLADFNPHTPSGKGFTFGDLKAEIDAGYPVLLFLQNYDELFRSLAERSHVNPDMHGMLAYGYYETDGGAAYVRYRSSWASGDNCFGFWGPQGWEANLPLRGVIGYHPLPRITQNSLAGGNLTLQWDGPAAVIIDARRGITRFAQGYVVEMTSTLTVPNFAPVSPTITNRNWTITNAPSPAYYRVKLANLPPE